MLELPQFSTMLQANELARRALGWAQTPLRTHVRDSFCVVGWSGASWVGRREGSSQTSRWSYKHIIPGASGMQSL